MGRTYKVIDSDGSCPRTAQFLAGIYRPAYRDRAPELIVDKAGKERFQVEGRLLGPPAGLGLIGAIGVREKVDGSGFMPRKCPSIWNTPRGAPEALIRTPGFLTWTWTALTPPFCIPAWASLPARLWDPQLAAAASRAYNRWLADYCAPYPDRLFGVAMLPMQSIELAVEEMRYARNALGMRAGFLRPNPYNDKMLGHRDYDVFWAEAQELDFSVGIHEGTGGMPAVGVERFRSFGAKHMVSHTMEMIWAALSIIWMMAYASASLKCGLVFWSQAGAGWPPGWTVWTAILKIRDCSTILR